MLPYPTYLTRTPEGQVPLGYLKAVRRSAHRFDPGSSILRTGLADKKAETAHLAPPHPAPELVKLRQAETMGILDHHDCGVPHVDPDLDDGRGYEDRQLSTDKPLHGGLSFLGRKLAVKDADLLPGEPF